MRDRSKVPRGKKVDLGSVTEIFTSNRVMCGLTVSQEHRLSSLVQRKVMVDRWTIRSVITEDFYEKRS